MLVVEKITKCFGAFTAVDDVSFSCGAGEVFGLLGPNGAGKTTLLRVLATVLRPSGGTARLAGYDLRLHPAEVRRVIGFLPAGAGLYGRLTARENLRYFGTLYGLPPKRLADRIEELLTRFNMTDAADLRAEILSTGTRQKVSLARALLHDPPLLLLDEPTEGLDVPTARAVHATIAEARAAGKCVLLSTHRMQEAERLCTRIGIIVGGRLRAVGTKEELAGGQRSADLEEIFLELVGESR